MTRTNTAIAAMAGATLLTAAAAAQAQSVFDGTWKTDTKTSQLSKRPDVWTLKGGVFSCKSCTPPYAVKADGAFHPIKGHPGTDETSIRIVDVHTIEQTDHKGGRVSSTGTATVSADGRTMTLSGKDTTNADAEPVESKVVERRVAKGAPGSHAVAGSWVMAKIESVSDAGLSQTIRMEGDTLSFTMPSGFGYSAKVGGPESPVKGDPNVNSVSLKKTGPRTVVETDKRDGKVMYTFTMTVSKDGKTLTTVSHNARTGVTTSSKATKM